MAATSPASRVGSAPTSIADDLAAAAESFSEGVADIVERAGELASALAQAVTEALGALLGGGDGGPAPAGQLVEQVASVVGNLVQALGALLVLGGGEPPAPATDNPLAQPVALLYERTAELFRGGGELVGQMAQAAHEALSGGGGLANHQQQAKASGKPVAPSDEPVAPPVAPIPAVPPLAPGGGSAPVGYYSSFLGASGSSASDAFQLLFAILVVFSVALLQGGRLSWLRRESHGPPAAVVLAIERPG